MHTIFVKSVILYAACLFPIVKSDPLFKPEHIKYNFPNLKEEVDMENLLLKIGRTVDENEVHYFVNLDKNRRLVEDEPIKILWKNNQKNGLYEKMNWIKKKYAYGIKYLKQNTSEKEFNFAALKSRKFYLKKNVKDEYAIFTLNNESEIKMEKIFVSIEGGGFWTPNVTKVELIGMEVKSNKAYLEIVKP